MKQIIEVQTAKDWKHFHRVLHRVYADTPQYIFPLEKEVQHVFQPDINKRFEHGEAQCYVLLQDGMAVGRVASFIDHEHNKTQSYPVGGIGFFECVQDDNLAMELLEKAEEYFIGKDIKAIDGPVNFGERDRFWGLLVKGFESAPLYQENYHPPHYRQWFEKAGYRPYEQVLTLGGDSKNIPFERFSAIAKRVKQRYPIRIRPLDFVNMEDFAKDFTQVYNAAFKEFPHFHPINPQQLIKLMEQAKIIADPQLVCIVYFDDTPAGFIALYPDINPLLKPAKGKMNFWKIPIFLLRTRITKSFNAKGMGFGVVPEFHSKGIFAILVDYLASPRNLVRYPRMLLAGIRTQNHEIRSMYDKMQVKVDRIHVTYRKMLDPNIPFEPHEFIDF